MRRCLALIAACALVQGCANLPLGNDGLSQEERRLRLEAVDHWQVPRPPRRGHRRARISRQLQLAARARRAHAVDPRAARRRSAANQRHARDAHPPRARGKPCAHGPRNRALGALGWWLPVGSLSAWLRGLEDEAFPAETEVAADGTLASLEQRLWRLDFITYQVASGLLVPRRIDLAHGDLKLRATIDSFTPMSSPASALN